MAFGLRFGAVGSASAAAAAGYRYFRWRLVPTGIDPALVFYGQSNPTGQFSGLLRSGGILVPSAAKRMTAAGTPAPFAVTSSESNSASAWGAFSNSTSSVGSPYYFNGGSLSLVNPWIQFDAGEVLTDVVGFQFIKRTDTQRTRRFALYGSPTGLFKGEEQQLFINDLDFTWSTGTNNVMGQFLITEAPKPRPSSFRYLRFVAKGAYAVNQDWFGRSSLDGGRSGFLSGSTLIPALDSRMTANNAPSPLVASASSVGAGAAYKLFSDDTVTPWRSTSAGGADWVKLDVGTPAAGVTGIRLVRPVNIPTRFCVDGSETGDFTGEQWTLYDTGPSYTWDVPAGTTTDFTW